MMRAYFALPCAALLLLFGCGGGGGSSTPSPYTGAWAGTFNAGNQQVGTLAVTIAQDGTLTGQINNTTAGVTGSVSGSVQNNGNVSVTTTYPGNPAVVDTGTVSLSAQGHLLGVVKDSGGTTTFDLTKQ